MIRFPLRSMAQGVAAAASLALGLAAGTAPTLAQNFYQDDIVVYGHERLPDDVQAISQRVRYGDLHLQYPEDRRELRRRVSVTAASVCDALGERDGDYRGSVASCRDEAMRDAMRQVRIVEARWTEAPRYYADNAHVWLPPRDWADEDAGWQPRR